MSMQAMDLTKGIRVDQGTQKGSVYDVIKIVSGKKGSYVIQVFSRIKEQYFSSIPRWYTLRINGKGQLTPVADAPTLIEVAWLCPGRAATEFRRKGAEAVCRLLGGDLSLVDEVQHRHAQVAGTAEEAFLLHKDGGNNNTAVTEAASNKRGLEDDDEVYATKKRQLIQEIDQATNASMIKAHAQTSVDVIAILSGGPVAPAPATLQLLQTIRHNVASRLSSMLDTGMQGQLAIQSSQQQQEQQQQQQQQLSINQQAQRWTVQMYASKLGLPASARTTERLKNVGAAAARIWSRERGLVSIEKASDGTLQKVWFDMGSNKPNREAYVSETEGHLFAEARMKYSLAYKGGWEAADRANFDTWTYPAALGAEVLQAAFDRVAVAASA